MKYRVSTDADSNPHWWVEHEMVPLKHQTRFATENEAKFMDGILVHGDESSVTSSLRRTLDTLFASHAAPVEAEDASDEEIALAQLKKRYPTDFVPVITMEPVAHPAPLFLRLTLVHDLSSVLISVPNIAAMRPEHLGSSIAMTGGDESITGQVAGPSAYRVTETIEEIDEKLPAWAVR